MASDGASNNERLLAAARTDNEDLLMEVFDESEERPFDINYQDGLGNTALHIAVENTSSDVLEHILAHENCDVDPINKLDKVTPLHLAVTIEDAELRKNFVESLLDAGADFTIRNKYGDTAQDLVKPDDTAVLDLFRQAQAQASISRDDIASDDDDGYDVASDGSE